MLGGTRTLSMLDFMRQLSNWGTWRAHPTFGWVWQPRQLAPWWEPYLLGEWKVAQDGSLCWASIEPFGWATYHYGRWFYDSALGWNWQPGTEWAPSWVVWRYRPGIVGWAAMPPVGATAEVCELAPADANLSGANPPDFSWVFVAQADLLSSSVRSVAHDAWLPADAFNSWNKLPSATTRIAGARNVNLVQVCPILGSSPSTPRALDAIIAAQGHSTAGRPYRSVSSPSAALALQQSSSLAIYAPTITGQVPTIAAPLQLIQRATPAVRVAAAEHATRAVPATHAAPAPRVQAFTAQEASLSDYQGLAYANLMALHAGDASRPPYEGFEGSALPEWQQREMDEQAAMNARQQAVLAHRHMQATRAPSAPRAAPVPHVVP